MVTKKVAGRGLSPTPAVMLPRNLAEPESHAVNVPGCTLPSNDSRTRRRELVLKYLPFSAVPFAVFGLAEMHDRPLIGALCIVAAFAVLMVGGAR